MSAYVLILTMAILVPGTTGYSGIGGVASIDVNNLSSCHRIALQWMKGAKEAAGLPLKSKKITYLCIKR